MREDAKVSSKGADKSEVFNAGGGGNFSVREKIKEIKSRKVFKCANVESVVLTPVRKMLLSKTLTVNERKIKSLL